MGSQRVALDGWWPQSQHRASRTSHTVAPSQSEPSAPPTYTLLDHTLNSHTHATSSHTAQSQTHTRSRGLTPTTPQPPHTQMDMGDNTRMLAEWSALVCELDRVTRESLGVNERGFSSNPTPDPARRRSRSFLVRSLSFFSTGAAPAAESGTTRPRSKSILGQIGGLLAPRKTSSPSVPQTDTAVRATDHTSPESPPKAWSQLTPPAQRPEQQRSNLGLNRLSPLFSSSSPGRNFGGRGASAKVNSRQILQKNEQLRLALAIHKEKARRRTESGMAQTPEEKAASTREAMRNVARAVAQARHDTQANVHAAAGNHAWEETATGRAGGSATRASVTAGPHAGRVLVELSRCRDMSRNHGMSLAAAAAPAVAWV
jgi:hypothetical protein